MVKQVAVGSDTWQVEDVGEGPVLLLVHGFPLDHTMWRHQIAQLQKSHRVLAPDLRGFGGSVVTSGTVTMETFADDLAKILDQLGVNESVTLCGLSMGGYVAWQFWKRHRDKLSRLILCDTRAAADTPDGRKTRHDTADKVLREGPEFLAQSMIPKLFAETSLTRWPDAVEDVRNVIRKTSPEGIAAASRGMAQRPAVTGWLSAIDVPTLLLAGTHDGISPPEEMREFGKLMPRAKFVEIAGAGHMSPLEQPDTSNAAIREFLAAE